MNQAKTGDRVLILDVRAKDSENLVRHFFVDNADVEFPGAKALVDVEGTDYPVPLGGLKLGSGDTFVLV